MRLFQHPARWSGGAGLAIGLILALFQIAQKNTPVLTVVLLVSIFVSLAYSIYQTGWVRNSKKTIDKITKMVFSIFFLLAVLILIGVWVWPGPIPPPHPETPTVLVRYIMNRLPISIPAKSTAYILQLHPKIGEGTYEESNDGSTDMWWPRKPPAKRERLLDGTYACQFTNYSDKALMDVAIVFDLSFYSVVEAQGAFKKNSDGTSSLSVTLPQGEVPGIKRPGILRAVFGEYWNGKVRAIKPGVFVAEQKHRAVLPSIAPHSSATLYLVNQSRLFVHFYFPTGAVSIVDGKPQEQPTVLIRPDVNMADKIPDFILAPSTYHWVGVPDAP